MVTGRYGVPLLGLAKSIYYANEAHNILMTGLDTHERFTIEMRFLWVPVFSIRQRKEAFF